MTSTNQPQNSQRLRNSLYTAAGTTVEWYDFTLYAYLAPTLAPLFFPTSNPAVGMIATFAVFATGYLVRPFGGAVIGNIGDTRGRKTALTLSVMLMMVPMAAMTVLPTYDQIGIWAPILLVCLRLIQGFSVGGELSGSFAALAEIAPREHRGRIVSMALAVAQIGILLASGTALLVTAIVGQEALSDGAWRIPFAFGVVIAGVALVFRRMMTETKLFEEDVADAPAPDSPLKQALGEHRSLLIRITVLAVWSGVGFYTIAVWLPSFLATRGATDQQGSLVVSTSMAALYAVVVIPLAMMGDRVGRRQVLLMLAGAFAVLGVPLLVLADRGGLAFALLGGLGLIVLQSLLDGNVTTAMVESVPTRIRFTGMALPYNIGMIAGGLTPLILTTLTEVTSSDWIAGVILAIVALCAIPTVRWLPRAAPELG